MSNKPYWNKQLKLKLKKNNKTIFSLFKILASEANLKSKTLGFYDRLIFDNFLKIKLYNKKVYAINFYTAFRSSLHFRRFKFSFFFFNICFCIFFSDKIESRSILRKLFLKKPFLSFYFLPSSLTVKQNSYISFWNFNISLSKLDKFLFDLNFFFDLKKIILHEEGARLFSQSIFLAKPFYIRFYNRKYSVLSLYNSLVTVKKYFVYCIQLGILSLYLVILLGFFLIFWFFSFIYFFYSLIFFFDALIVKTFYFNL